MLFFVQQDERALLSRQRHQPRRNEDARPEDAGDGRTEVLSGCSESDSGYSGPLVFATDWHGRRVEYFDMPTIRAITADASENEYNFSSFVVGVINSPAFQNTRVEAAATAAPPA